MEVEAKLEKLKAAVEAIEIEDTWFGTDAYYNCKHCFGKEVCVPRGDDYVDHEHDCPVVKLREVLEELEK